MRILHKYLTEFLFFYSFIIVTTMAQTPFQGLFGFFGSGQSNNAAPVITLTNPTAMMIVQASTQTSVAVSGTCSVIGRTVTITSSAITLGTTTCSSSKTFSTTVDVTSLLDGTRSISASMSNVLGVTATATRNIDKDVVGPTITFPSNMGFVGGSNSNVTFTITERHATTGNYVLEVSQDNGATWAALGNVAGTAGNLFNQTFSYNWNPVSNWNISTAKIKITSTDSLGQSTTQISNSFIVDSGKPSIDVGSFSINLGAGSTSSTSVRLALTASDTYSNITQFCFKHTDATEPTLADGCWTSVSSPATTLSLSNFPFTLPPVFGTYDVYAWVRDAGGNISALSNSGAGTNALDKASIIYVPPVPATLIDVIASSTDNPSNPLTSSDLTTSSGSSVYIKWKATDDKVFPGSPITLYYTTDDLNYTLIATNVDNTSNPGCTISGAQTGCYVWTNGSPTSSYYRIRVTVTDSDASTTASTSPPLNVSSTFNMLAGNTEAGTNGSASAAMFINTFLSPGQSDPRSFVVTSAGVLYFLDNRRGLLKVDPSSGVQELLIRETGTSAGDGQPITNPGVTFNNANQIIMDYQENLYIYEYQKIRKIDMSLNPPVITTIIGGGSGTGTNISATTLRIAPELTKSGDFSAIFFATPDGKIYFRSDYNTSPISTYGKLRYYDPTNSKVFTKFSINGFVTMAGVDRDIANCGLGSTGYAFDPVSSEITYGITMPVDRGNDVNCPGSYVGYLSEIDASNGTLAGVAPSIPSGNYSNAYFSMGMDGQIYSVFRASSRMYRYDGPTKTWVHVLGVGKGNCVDGTLATACPLELIDAFITKNSVVYFIDRGRIRTIDPISKKVYTLYGQTFSAGDGGHPLSARFSAVTNMKSWDDAGVTKFVLLDYPELRFREFNVGGTISTIAGNGIMAVPDTTNPANTQSLGISTGATWYGFVLHPTSGKLYYARNYNLSYIDRTTGKWVSFIGGGANNYYDSGAEGALGNQINFPGYFPWVLDINSAGQLLVGSHVWTVPGSTHSMLKLYDGTDGKQSHFAGVTGISPTQSTICADGSATATCSIPTTTVLTSVYDSYRDKFLMTSLTTTTSTTVVKLMTPGGVVTDYRNLPRLITSLAYHRDAGLTYEWFYYCDTGGALYKYNNLTAVETRLYLPSTTMTCQGRGLFYSSARNSLVFGYTQNGLGGVAEYPNP